MSNGMTIRGLLESLGLTDTTVSCARDRKSVDAKIEDGRVELEIGRLKGVSFYHLKSETFTVTISDAKEGGFDIETKYELQGGKAEHGKVYESGAAKGTLDLCSDRFIDVIKETKGQEIGCAGATAEEQDAGQARFEDILSLVEKVQSQVCKKE